jgi:hypothetical protein
MIINTNKLEGAVRWHIQKIQTQILVFVAALLICGEGQAQPNGCGSGWSTYVVPDKIALLQCTMKSACDAHDDCYSVCKGRTDGICLYQKCRAGGELAGQDACLIQPALIQSAGAAMTRRAQCDVKLAEAIIDANPNRWPCRAIAIIYREAVKLWGDGAFAGYGSDQTPAAWKQSQADYEAAIAAFLAKASEADFRKFVESYEQGTDKLNFCGRLQYVDGQGLRNVDPREYKQCAFHLK